MSDNVVGSAEFELRAKRDKLKQDLDQAGRDLKSFGDGAEKSMGGAGNAMGMLGRLGPIAAAGIGLVTAALAAAASMAVRFSFEALRFADDMASTARKIGFSTDALQEWRHVAERTGSTAAEADRALESFANKFEQAASGLNKEAIQAFAALRIGRDQLRSFESAEQALDVVVDRINDLGSASDRAAIADRMGLGALSTALIDGADDVATLRNEARALGVVMDAEMIRRASQAQDQFDQLARIIDVQLKQSFIDLAPAILGAIQLVAQLAQALASAMDQWRRLEDRTSRGLKTERNRLEHENLRLRQANPEQRRFEAPVVGSAGSAAGPGAYLVASGTGRSNEDQIAANNREIARINNELSSRAVEDRPSRPTSEGGLGLVLPTTRGPRERVDRSAEREARRAERVQAEINRLKEREYQIADRDLLNAQQRHDLNVAALRIAREGEDAELRSRLAREDLTQAEYDQLTAQNTINRALEDRISQDITFREIQDERIAKERALADLTSELLSLQSGAARTARERREIETELLRLAQQQRRNALNLQMDRENWSPERRAEATGTMGRIEDAERAAVNRSTMSPLERWRDESLRSIDEVNEAYERVAANGLDALNDGLVDAIMGTKDLGEVFSNVARQIIADLMSIAVRRGITEPLGDALFGGRGKDGGYGMGGQGGGWLPALGNIFGNIKLPGFATGGDFTVSGTGGIDSQLVAFKATPGERVSVSTAGKKGGGGDTYHFSGNLMTPEFWAMIQAGDRRAAMAGARQGMAGAVGYIGANASTQQRQDRMFKG